MGVFAVALAVNLGAGAVQGLNRKLESDAFYYFQLATSLARGEGYVIKQGFWPEAPSLQRMPGWPAAAAVALKLTEGHGLPRPAVMRTLNLTINAACAAAVSLLALALFRRPVVGVVAGGLYLLHPMGLVCADEGMSEPLFVLLAVTGAWLLQRGLAGVTADTRFNMRRIAAVLAGFLLLGLACLVRANFAMWIFFFGAGVAWWTLRAGLWRRPAWWAVMFVGTLIFVTPPLLWAVRNYRVCGAFPVMSTLRGQTYYGGNNALTAEGFKYWGYWVFPNEIPGETPLYDLSRTMSEHEVDVYYYEKGQAYLREHPGRVPGLLLGKLIRAYVPVPWHWTAGTLGMAGARMVLYGLFFVGVCRAWCLLVRPYPAIFSGMVFTNVMMVLTFYGYSRFAFALEPFFMPFAAVALVDLVGWQWSSQAKPLQEVIL